MSLLPDGGSRSEKIKQLIKKINKSGITVVLIAHDVKLVTSVTDRITAIEFGVKIAEGTPDEVKNAPKVVEHILGATNNILKVEKIECFLRTISAVRDVSIDVGAGELVALIAVTALANLH
jgi:ABC-type branched-subunit amino acid transport system ATPase component